jgi:hypothetical protein
VIASDVRHFHRNSDLFLNDLPLCAGEGNGAEEERENPQSGLVQCGCA